ncbi:hypothetical protein SLA2020_216080 [Shorea laevis]
MMEVQVATARNNAAVKIPIGVVLDLDSRIGKEVLSCINMALSDFYSNRGHYRTKLVLHTRDSKNDVIGAAAAALDLVKNEHVQAIIGPGNLMQENFIIDLGKKSRVPIISFATTPLTSTRSPYLFRATQSHSSQIKAIAAIVHFFGWREVVPIFVDNESAEGIIPYLSDALEDVDARIPHWTIIPPGATDEEVKGELYNLTKLQTTVFIVHMDPTLGSKVFDIAKEIGMMSEGYVWIITDKMTNLWSLVDHFDTDSMQGVLAIRNYVPKSNEFDNFKVRWKRIVKAKLDIFGLWAYDATFALAKAVEKLGTKNFSLDVSNVSGSARTDLESFGVSQNGPELIRTLSSIRFKGLSSEEFSFVNGQLESSVLRIVNVNENFERGIGFWTSKSGLVKKLDFENVTRNSASMANLGTIIWPGDPQSVPIGWKIQTLKIGVPVKNGFIEFVEAPNDTSPNSIVSPKGYCIAVFKAVMNTMKYNVTYNFYAFKMPDGEKTGYYDDLVYQVAHGNYDAVVGDISIRAERSLYVDFTLPFMESGVVIVVPIKDDENKNAWVFLKPLTWDLWVASGCFFVFIGFVIWVLEHRINGDFRGPPSHHVGTSLWFSFSTMVFAHRERVVSNSARFVVVIWCFVVLILTQSYTASLTSLLTVQQLQPSVTDLNELVRKGENVAYQDGTFVQGIVQNIFDPSKIKTFKSVEDLDKLFTKGSAKGGIAAAFDEIPYMNLFLEKYPDKYTTIEPTFKTEGFGFVFPKGSPLGAEVSRAFLRLSEGDEIKKIEERYLPRRTRYLDSRTSNSSKSLGLESFRGLFLITGVAAILALIIFAAEFLYEQREVLRDSGISIWKRILQLIRNFDLKDLTSYTF